MVRVVYSDRFEQLAGALRRDLGGGDLFATRVVCVPNNQVAAHLEIDLALAGDIVANVRFPFLEPYLAERIEASRPGLRVVDRVQLQMLVFRALGQTEVLARPAMEPIRRYLDPDADGDAAASEQRKLQLSGRVAGLLLEYAGSRTAMLGAWERGPALADTPHQATEAWQRELWLAVFGPGGIAEGEAPDGERWHTLWHLARQLRPAEIALPRRLAVFGFSQLRPETARLLARLSKVCELSIYAFNPCREFWDDVGSESGDSGPLRVWGRPGRDTARMLGEAAGYDFDARFSEPDAFPPTRLGQLQRSVLLREPPPAQLDVAPQADPSVRVLACPSPRRELEVVATDIWTAVRSDPELRLSDIAVLIAQRNLELYQAHVSSVFHELHQLPHSVLDVPIAEESRAAEAIALLLDLPLSDFGRPELLRLLTHPCVLGDAAEVDPADWVQWADRLGIVHGADRSDHAGTYIERDLYNWDQGIRRLSLGACMAEPAANDPAGVAFGGAAYVPEPVPQSARHSAARFGLLCRSLIADARALRSARLPLRDWAATLDDLAVAYVAAASDDDTRCLERCREALRGLAAADLTGEHVGFVTARELALSSLSSLTTRRGEYLGEGVVVAPLGPMRPLPFRIIYVVGMGEGEFPAGDRESSLDLRSAQPALGDVSPRDRDRYAFLETVMAARQQLVMSYVARDEQSGDPRAPSSVVVELETMVGGVERTAHPLRPYDARYTGNGADLPCVDVAAARQAQSAALRADLERHLAERGLAMPPPAVLRRALDRPQLSDVARHVGLWQSAGVAPADPDVDEPLVLPVSTVRRFLECPLQAWASHVLRMRPADEDTTLTRGDEPFASPLLQTIAVLRSVFTTALAAGRVGKDELANAYHKRASVEELSGRAPTGVFGELEQSRHIAVLTTWLEQLEGAGGSGAPLRQLSFGRAPRGATHSELLPPISVEVEGRRVDLVGDVHPVSEAAGSVVLATSPRPPARHALRGLVDRALLAAAGIDEGPGHVIVLSSGAAAEQRAVKAWSRDDALAYLGALIGELLGTSHDYFLPCEAVLDHAARPRRPLAVCAQRLRDGSQARHSSMYGPVRRAAELPVPADARDIARRRFGPLLERTDMGSVA